MKSIRSKLIISISILLLVSLTAVAFIAVVENYQVMNEIIQVQYEDQLSGAKNMLKVYLDEQFGSLNMKEEGILTDADGTGPSRGNMNTLTGSARTWAWWRPFLPAMEATLCVP